MSQILLTQDDLIEKIGYSILTNQSAFKPEQILTLTRDPLSLAHLAADFYDVIEPIVAHTLPNVFDISLMFRPDNYKTFLIYFYIPKEEDVDVQNLKDEVIGILFNNEEYNKGSFSVNLFEPMSQWDDNLYYLMLVSFSHPEFDFKVGE